MKNIGDKGVTFKVTADTFRAVANCDKYSLWAKVLNGILGGSIITGAAALGAVSLLGITVPYLVPITIGGGLACFAEWLLGRNLQVKERVANNLRLNFITKVQDEVHSNNRLVDACSFKLERVSPIDNMKVLEFKHEVGKQGSNDIKTVQCKDKVGTLTEIYRVSDKHGTLGYYEVVTEREPIQELGSSRKACNLGITASEPAYSFKFHHPGEGFMESLPIEQRTELLELEKPKTKRRGNVK